MLESWFLTVPAWQNVQFSNKLFCYKLNFVKIKEMRRSRTPAPDLSHSAVGVSATHAKFHQKCYILSQTCHQKFARSLVCWPLARGTKTLDKKIVVQRFHIELSYCRLNWCTHDGKEEAMSTEGSNIVDHTYFELPFLQNVGKKWHHSYNIVMSGYHDTTCTKCTYNCITFKVTVFYLFFVCLFLRNSFK